MNHADIMGLAVSVFCCGLALIVVIHKPRSAAHWAFIVGMGGFSAENALFAFSVNAVLPSEMIFWQKWSMVAACCTSAVWLLFSLAYARGNGSAFLRDWRPVLAAAFLVPVGVAALFGYDLLASSGQNATGLWMFREGMAGAVLNLCSLLLAILVLMNLESTFRAAIGTMLWRIKFMVLGVGLIFIVKAYLNTQVLLFHNTLSSSLQEVGAVGTLVGGVLILRSLARPGHFETDVYPSKSVVHGSLILLLAGVYFFIVGVFARVVEFFGGDATFTLKAFILLVALVLFSVLALSDRLRQLARRFWSRRFHRPVYDYRSIWRRFTGETASSMQPLELCRVTVKFLAEVLETLSVTIWLVDDERERFAFGASTFLSESRANSINLANADALVVIHALENLKEPVDIDASRDNWAAVLRQCHPDEFYSGGNRVCAPLIGSGQMLGLIILGDRVKGLPFSWQDFDLLKCVADSVAAGLVNIQLSKKLLQAGQMEAFQTMSAFFVHDLKNTISSLNLMLKNLPLNFEDPEFRKDSLRGISRTIAHVNHIIQRLGQLRGRLQVKPVASDLNDLVLSVLSGLEAIPQINIVRAIHPLPKILLDQEQMEKVVANLVFNAREAVASAGEVRVETSQKNGWAVLSVSDNGCGISPEFLNYSLFRPFQTTKKNGLGIGLFQSKMIVEAHKGRIQVESQPGKGTTFRIILPLPNQPYECQTAHC